MNLTELLQLIPEQYRETLKQPATDLLKRTYKAGVRDGQDKWGILTDTELCEKNINYFLGEEG